VPLERELQAVELPAFKLRLFAPPQTLFVMSWAKTTPPVAKGTVETKPRLKTMPRLKALIFTIRLFMGFYVSPSYFLELDLDYICSIATVNILMPISTLAYWLAVGTGRT